jgi:uncharacterized damage-inducible protein DinB
MADLVAGLPAGALDWRPAEGASSLTGLAHHILHVERAMALEAATGETDWDRTEGFGTDARGDEPALAALIDEADATIKRALEALPADGLLRVTQPDDRSVGSGLVEEFDHGAMHLGQMQLTRRLWEQAHPEHPTTYEHWG